MKKKILAIALSSVMLMSVLGACGNNQGATTETTGATEATGTTEETSETTDNGSEAKPEASGQVYYLNFKPEQDEVYQQIASEYTEKTGVPVKVVTAASGTYEQQLRSEIAKNDAPTIFQVNGPVGYSSWKDYTLDLKDSEIYSHLTDKGLAISEGEGVYGIPFAIEGYGIVVNNKIMDKYFALDGAKAKSMDDIKSFVTLKEVVEDMQSKRADLGIEGVFASTSLAPGEDWRWQTHLSNVPLHYEFEKNKVDLTNASETAEIKFEYSDNFKNIFELYLNNSTIAPTMTGSKTVNDSMSEFALGEACMVQNGNWAYGQISGVTGNIVKEEDVTFIPIYIGVDGEEKQGLCIGTENFFCINKNAKEEDQKASLDFLNWLYTSDEGKVHVTEDLGFIAPFDSFTENETPKDPLGKQVVSYLNNPSVTNVPWDFTIYPSQQFKDDFGAALLQYAQGQMEWDIVVSDTISNWKTEKEVSVQ